MRLQIAVVLVSLSVGAHACSVPVCRYALEHWEPHPYTLTLFHSGPLSLEAEKATAILKKLSDNGVQATLDIVDVAKPMNEDKKELWQKQKDATLPWLVVETGEPLKSITAGAVTPAFATKLVKSPVRESIASHISQGCSIAWVLLESGDRDADNAAARMLDDVLKTSQQDADTRFAEMIAQEKEASDGLPSPGGIAESVHFAFRSLRLSRKDPAEEVTVKMLLAADEMKHDATQPLIFAVFGRGRIAPPIVGTAGNKPIIVKAAEFLTQQCSCDIKQSLEGFDLLIDFDWSNMGPVDTAPVSEPAPVLPAPAPPPSNKPTPPPSETATKAPAATWCDLIPVIGMVLSLLLLAAPGALKPLLRRNPLLRYALASAGLIVSLTALLYTGRAKPVEASGEPLVVFCAPSLKAPVEAAVASYEREFHRQIVVQFGASEALLTNVKLGQKGDLFIPADSSFVDRAAAEHLTAEIIPVAEMTPVIGVKKGNPKNIRSIDDLLKSDTRTLLASQAAAITHLTRAKLTAVGRWRDFERAAQEKTIAEAGTVTDVANNLKLGTVDAGIIFDAMAAQYPELEIIHDPTLDSISANVSLAVLATSSQPSFALHFARYLTANGKGIEEFRSRGYRTVAADEWDETPELKILAGAMLRPAIIDTLHEFQQREGVKLSYDFQGCGILVAKMKAGDHPDMFIACDASFEPPVRSLFGAPVTLSSNDIVIAVPKGNPQGIKTLKDLAEKKMKIGVGNEKQCALGVLTQQRLEEANLCQAIMKNVTTQLPTGDLLVNLLRARSLDTVIVYRSNITGFDDIESVSVDVPLVKAQQPLVIGNDSRHPRLAARLRTALLSAESRQRFTKAGFEWKGSQP